MKSDIGLIGLAVMGKNLVLNIERGGFRVSVFNRTFSTAQEFLSLEAKGKNITGHETLAAFVASLEKPRKIILMVKAGAAVDDVLAQLKPLLEKEDIVIDAGNSLYQDTDRRFADFSQRGIHYVGMGVSGGEEGALLGASLMPGGARAAYEKLFPFLEKIAADSDAGRCVTYIGKGGAGHFVKMVHNGIEYADMQLIAEAYDIMKRGLGLDPLTIAKQFSEWNEGLLKSYLIEITAEVLRFKEAPNGPYLIDRILDKAGQKGTGNWTVKAALDEGVALPTIAAAVDARTMSALKEERVRAAKEFSGLSWKRNDRPEKDFLLKLMLALYASKIGAFAQGFALMRAADQKYAYGFNLAEIARIWKGGCIIRSAFLDRIRKAFTDQPHLANLMTAPDIKDDLLKAVIPWQDVLTFAVRSGIPTPAMSASFAYFTSYVTDTLPANLIQAQRDYFGAHTFERIDKSGIFHNRWTT